MVRWIASCLESSHDYVLAAGCLPCSLLLVAATLADASSDLGLAAHKSPLTVRDAAGGWRLAPLGDLATASRVQHASATPSPRFALADEEEEAGWAAVGREMGKVSRAERLEVGTGPVIGVPVAAQVLRAQKQKPLLGEELSSALESRESFWRGRAR